MTWLSGIARRRQINRKELHMKKTSGIKVKSDT